MVLHMKFKIEKKQKVIKSKKIHGEIFYVSSYMYDHIKALPSVHISQSVTPNDHTSEAVVNSLFRIDSIAIHLSGRRAVLVLT